MDGVEFEWRVRERSNVPVVFVSAWAEELEKQLRGTQLAADDYIAVPFSLQNVVTRVESVLELRRAPVRLSARSLVTALNAVREAAQQ